MNKRLLAVGLAATLAMPVARATMQVTPSAEYGQYSSTFNNGTIGGGEFRATANPELKAAINWNAYSTSTGDKDSSWFQTFCIEYGEHFTPGNTYNVTLGPNAMNGGVSSGGDPISKATAFLYSQFAAGALTGYNYNYGGSRTASAKNLQMMIWALEGEGGYTIASQSTSSFTNPFYTFLMNNFSTVTDSWDDDSGGAYGVQVMTLGEPGQYQDMLVMTPVPEPSTVMAGALLLLPFGISAIRRFKAS